MRVVQALHWLQDMLPGDAARVKKRLQSISADPEHGPAIVADLRDGLSTLPIWMQVFLRDLIGKASEQAAAVGDDHHNTARHQRQDDDAGDRHRRRPRVQQPAAGK